MVKKYHNMFSELLEQLYLQPPGKWKAVTGLVDAADARAKQRNLINWVKTNNYFEGQYSIKTERRDNVLYVCKVEKE